MHVYNIFWSYPLSFLISNSLILLSLHPSKLHGFLCLYSPVGLISASRILMHADNPLQHGQRTKSVLFPLEPISSNISLPKDGAMLEQWLAWCCAVIMQTTTWACEYMGVMILSLLENTTMTFLPDFSILLSFGHQDGLWASWGKVILQIPNLWMSTP